MTGKIPIAKTYKLFIDGAFPRSESGRTFSVNDTEGELIANVSQASRKDFREAVRAARAAQLPWASRTAYNRGQILYRVAEMLESRKTEFVELLLDQIFSSFKRFVLSNISKSKNKVSLFKFLMRFCNINSFIHFVWGDWAAPLGNCINFSLIVSLKINLPILFFTKKLFGNPKQKSTNSLFNHGNLLSIE